MKAATIFLFLGLLSFLHPEQARSKMIGLYTSKRKGLKRKHHFHGDVSMRLKADSTFEYDRSTGCLSSTRSSGKWKVAQGGIILNSDFLPHEPRRIANTVPFMSKKLVSDSIQIKVSDQEGRELPGAACKFIFKGKMVGGAYSDEQGLISLGSEKVDSVAVFYLLYQHEGLSLANRSHNYFEIRLVEQFVSESDDYRFFQNEFWKYKRGKLYDPAMEGDKLFRSYYKKSPTSYHCSGFCGSTQGRGRIPEPFRVLLITEI